MFDKARDIFIAFNLDEAAKYFDSISIEEFESLINKPDFFSTIYEKLTFLSCVSKDNLVKTKSLLKHIVDNDIDSILNDKYSLKGFMGCLISEQNKELLNCFLEIVPLEKVEIILDYLFSGNLYLDDILFNEYNKEIISCYIIKCCNNNDEDKLLKIFRVIYGNSGNQSNWIEFIIARLLVEDKLDLFLEYYKGLFDNDDNLFSIKDKEELISLLISLMNVISKESDDDVLLKKFMNNLFQILSSDVSEKLVTYMNDLVSSWLNDTSNISSKILKSPILIKYILPKNVIRYEQIKFSRIMREVDFVSSDEIGKIFFDDEININLIKNFDSSTLIEFFLFDCIDISDENDEMLSIFKSILKKYFSYEKAIFFVDKLKINNIEKKEIINDVYHDKKIDDIKIEKDKLISRCKNELLNLGDEVSELFKSLLPELIELPYDNELFDKLKNDSLKINKLEYLFVYLSQCFKHGCKIIDLNYNDYHPIFIPKYCRTNGLTVGEQVIVNYEDYLEDEYFLKWQNVEYIETVNHEKTHLWQDTMSSVISMDALMIGLEKNLIADKEYYKSNYYNIYMEVHARMVSVYETFRYLKEIDLYTACYYLARNKYLFEDHNEELLKKKEEKTRLWNDVVNSGEASSEEEQRKLVELEEEIKKLEQKIANINTFNKDRKLAKSIEYFANLINTFLERTTKEEIIDLRKGFKTLELITDNDGRFYDVNEIEERMNSIKSYSTNDIEFNPIDRDTKLFYARYLHNLRYCIDNGLIKFDGANKGKK